MNKKDSLDITDDEKNEEFKNRSGDERIDS